MNTFQFLSFLWIYLTLTVSSVSAVTCPTITPLQQQMLLARAAVILRREITVVSTFVQQAQAPCVSDTTDSTSTSPSLCQRVSQKKLESIKQLQEGLNKLYKEMKGVQFGDAVRFASIWAVWVGTSLWTHGGTTLFLFPAVADSQNALNECNSFLGDLEYMEEHLRTVVDLLTLMTKNEHDATSSKHLSVQVPIDYHAQTNNLYQLKVHYVTLIAQQKIIQEVIRYRRKKAREQEAENFAFGLLKRATLGTLTHNIEGLYDFLPDDFGKDILDEITGHLTRDGVNALFASLNADLTDCMVATRKYKTIRALRILLKISKRLTADVKYMIEQEEKLEHDEKGVKHALKGSQKKQN